MYARSLLVWKSLSFSSLPRAGLPLPLRERVGVRGNQFRPDSFEHTFCIAQYLIVPESDYAKSLRFQVHGPPGITLHFICVLTPVDLHDQSLLKANEIQMPPQQLLCVCLVGAKVSGQILHLDLCITPLTPALSRKGRGGLTLILQGGGRGEPWDLPVTSSARCRMRRSSFRRCP